MTYIAKRRCCEKFNSDSTMESDFEKKYIAITDVYSIENELHFSGVVNKGTIEEAIKLIGTMVSKYLLEKNGKLQFNKNDNKNDNKKLTITIIIDSPGGSVTSVLKFVDYVNMLREKYNFIEFVSILTGLCASAATIMAIVANKSYATKNAEIMIHELHSADGYHSLTHLNSRNKNINDSHNKLTNIYLEKIGNKLSREQLEQYLNKETWFTSSEYLDMGFIDGIK